MAEVIPIRQDIQIARAIARPVPEPALFNLPASARRRRGVHVHEFDPQSGWCLHCSQRDDGRVVGPGGTILRDGETELERGDDAAR